MDEKLTRQVAHLARLDLSDSEVKTLTPQLGEILKYIEKLQEADVTGIEPLTHPLELSFKDKSPNASQSQFRDDEITPSPQDENGKPKVLKSAPDVLYDGYKVPQIL